MKKLLFKKNSEFKAIISLYILFYIINFCSNQQMDEFKLEEIDKFYNNRGTDIQQLAEELEFYRRNSALAKGGV